MSKFILIIWWYTANGVFIKDVEFGNQAACEQALKQWDGEGCCAPYEEQPGGE